MNNAYNTHNLRHSANFFQTVYPGIHWVPVNVLGYTRYRKDDILSFMDLSPEIKRLKIGSLYEAIQLLQHGRFKTVEDNTLIENDGIYWTFHTQGYNAIVNNAGCCATVANWLYYILNGKYEEIGIITIISEVGTGHAMNYIRHNGLIYIIDINAYIYEYKEYVQPETGLLCDYRKSKIVTAALFQADSLESFTKFYSTFVGRFKRKKFLYCRHPSEITWEGLCKKDDKSIEIFCPRSNTYIIGQPPAEISIRLMSSYTHMTSGR